ncbi:hypothetical protein [Undibacterium sp.]|uniref:hypothetical protein n=1 Tax=Undibacterium sp. TaxID=1914977 RepID=UPI002731A478|nr:hypothetical protein [Undibacterium sp.]MDP1976871.1 hypothetical protein [Undibacterium sp.]
MNETIGIDQSIAATLASQGFVILRGFLEQAELSKLEQACQSITNEYGVRQVLQAKPNIAQSLRHGRKFNQSWMLPEYLQQNRCAACSSIKMRRITGWFRGIRI